MPVFFSAGVMYFRSDIRFRFQGRESSGTIVGGVASVLLHVTMVSSRDGQIGTAGAWRFDD